MAECRAVAVTLGLTYVDRGNYGTKGCYAYDDTSASYAGKVYYGTYGTVQKGQSSLAAPKYRPCPVAKAAAMQPACRYDVR